MANQVMRITLKAYDHQLVDASAAKIIETVKKTGAQVSGAVPLPTTESMKTELANLNAEKERFLAEYKAARTEAQEYETVKQNVDALLTVPKEQEQQRRHELE